MTDTSRFPYFAQMWGTELCGGALIAPDIVLSAAHVSFTKMQLGTKTQAIQARSLTLLFTHAQIAPHSIVHPPAVRVSASKSPIFSSHGACLLLPGLTFFLVPLLTDLILSTASNSVRVGRTSRTSADNSEFITISQKVIYPNYTSGKFPYDMMVMKLSNPSTHQYLQINSNSALPTSGQQLTVMGFGETIPSDMFSIPTQLQEVQVNYVDQSTCAAMQVNTLTSDMMCAAASGKDSW